MNLNNRDNLLIIFTRNIEPGKCKTRLARTVGPEIALNIYQFLVQHTAEICSDINATKWVYYTEYPAKDDSFDDNKFTKYIQTGDDLGARMRNALADGFSNGFKKIVIIGSDIYDLGKEDLNEAFSQLNLHEYVIGPAEDGGYYLLGMKSMHEDIFTGKPWGTAEVLKETLEDLKTEDVKLLEMRNDVDIYDDIKDVPVFQQFLKDWKNE